MDYSQIEALLQELTTMQRDKMLRCARQLIPHLTADDILQPVDFPELENNPYFRYEEGVLEGILTVQASLRSL